MPRRPAAATTPGQATAPAGFRLVVVTLTALLYAAMDAPGAAPAVAYMLLAAGVVYFLLLLLPVWQEVPARSRAVVTRVADGTLLLAWIHATGGFASPFFVLLFLAGAASLPHGPRLALATTLAYAGGYVALMAARGELAANAPEVFLRAGALPMLGALAVIGWRRPEAPAARPPVALGGILRRLADETTTTGVAHVLVAAAAAMTRKGGAALHLAPVDDLRTGLGPLRCAAAQGLAPGAEQALGHLYWTRRDQGTDGLRLNLGPGAADAPADLAGVGPIVGVPVAQQGQVIGVLSVAFGRDQPDAHTTEALEALADLAATAIVRVRTRRALEEQRAQFQRLSEAALEGVAIVDGGLVVEANHAFLSLFGWSADEVAGSDILECVEEAGRGDLAKLLTEGAGSPQRFQGLRRDGRPIPVEVVAREYPYMRHRASVVAVRDLTDRLRAEADRKAAEERQHEVERLQEISRFRSNLLNAASHELKTPITPLKLQLHLLKSGRLGPLSARQERSVNILDRNLSRLEQLVSDVLDVAHLESGRLVLRARPLDLNPMIFEAVETFDEGAREAGVTLDAHLHGSIWVNADPARVSQVLNNLLSNALKFTPRGGRILVRSGLADGQEGLDAWVRVEDTGIGLAPDQIARLFQPFSQVHDLMQTSQPGTGLGLYISRGIVERHGGAITCESGGRGLGTTFRFTLPKATATVPANAPAPNESVPLADSAGRRDEGQGAVASPQDRGTRPGWEDRSDRTGGR